jgi:hypothetical protein
MPNEKLRGTINTIFSDYSSIYVSKMRPLMLCWYLLALLASGAQAAVLSFAACATACAGTAAGWNSFVVLSLDYPLLCT